VRRKRRSTHARFDLRERHVAVVDVLSKRRETAVVGRAEVLDRMYSEVRGHDPALLPPSPRAVTRRNDADENTLLRFPVFANDLQGVPPVRPPASAM